MLSQFSTDFYVLKTPIRLTTKWLSQRLQSFRAINRLYWTDSRLKETLTHFIWQMTFTDRSYTLTMPGRFWLLIDGFPGHRSFSMRSRFSMNFYVLKTSMRVKEFGSNPYRANDFHSFFLLSIKWRLPGIWFVVNALSYENWRWIFGFIL